MKPRFALGRWLRAGQARSIQGEREWLAIQPCVSAASCSQPCPTKERLRLPLKMDSSSTADDGAGKQRQALLGRVGPAAETQLEGLPSHMEGKDLSRKQDWGRGLYFLHQFFFNLVI